MSKLKVAWTSPIKVSIPIYGGMSSAPIVVNGKVYLQDMKSDAYALNAATGKQLWAKTYNSPDEGVNGLQIQYGKAYGVNVTSAFALQASTGEQLWTTKLTRSYREGLEVAPGVYDNRMIVATTPTSPRGHYIGGADGVVWALNATTGKKEWSWNTSIDGFKLWGNPKVNSGGGIWGTPAYDKQGNVYLDIANPAPFPGTKKYPWGSSRKGPNLYSDSVVKLNASTGKLEWYHQLTPHDLYDHDLQLAPILTTANGKPVVISAGKGGIVMEVNAKTGKLLWKRPVGIHNGHDNDGLKSIHSPQGMPNPKKAFTVLPGELGGVETSMAVGGGMVYAPAANAGTTVSGNGVAAGLDLNHTSADFTAVDVDTGKVVWDHHFPVADFGSATYVNGLVFTTTYDGTVWALDAKTGKIVWHAKLPAGTNAGVSVAGNMLIAEADVATKASQHQEVVAYQLPNSNSTASTSSSTTSSASTTAAGTSTTASSSSSSSTAVSLSEGKSVFTTNCATCHTLAAAGSSGDVGPNLDQLKPSDALVTHQVTYGGGVMPAFGKSGKLSKTQIAAVAKFVSSEAGNVKAKSNGGSGNP